MDRRRHCSSQLQPKVPTTFIVTESEETAASAQECTHQNHITTSETAGRITKRPNFVGEIPLESPAPTCDWAFPRYRPLGFLALWRTRIRSLLMHAQAGLRLTRPTRIRSSPFCVEKLRRELLIRLLQKPRSRMVTTRKVALQATGGRGHSPRFQRKS